MTGAAPNQRQLFPKSNTLIESGVVGKILGVQRPKFGSKGAVKKIASSLLCDGCAVNTGVNGGIIRRLELYLCRPLQWLICLLHCNELPFKDIFKYLDGITQGPGSYSGPIGKKIVGDVHKMPIVKYEAIPGLLKTYTDACIKSLSSDQKYLYFICHAVQDGVLPKDTTLLSRSPGMMHEARWLTKANRIMRGQSFGRAAPKIWHKGHR